MKGAAFLQEVPIQYNLCNEPWLKYSSQVIADRGLKPSQLTSARLHKEVLYLETVRCVLLVTHCSGDDVSQLFTTFPAWLLLEGLPRGLFPRVVSFHGRSQVWD